MTNRDDHIRPLTAGEMNTAMDWAAAEGWNPGLHDGPAFFAADPAGFFVGEIDQTPVSLISGVRYGKNFGFIGFYIVKPDFRGQGYGIKIWQAGLARLAGRNVGLDGVVDQQENYKKSGFKLAYRNIRWQGVTGGSLPDTANLADLRSLSFDRVTAYDRAFFPDDRSGFLKSWLSQPASVSLGVMEKQQLRGYGMIRQCRSGYKIGPLFADAPEPAEMLFHALCAKVNPGRPVYLDTPEPNAAAVALAEKHGMEMVFETARMYTRKFPDLPVRKIFSVTSFELG